MATRFYFDSAAAAAVSPAFGSGWDKSDQAVRLRLNRTTQSSAMQVGRNGVSEDYWDTTGTGTAQFTLAIQYVVTGLAAQTLSGTVKGQMRGSQSASGANCNLAFRVAKAASDGSGVTEIVAVSASDLSTTPPEFTGEPGRTNRQFQNASESASITVPSTSISENDILIVEVGVRTTSTALRGFKLVYGDDNATDLGENNTDTSDFNPWIEFSGDITFAGEGGDPVLTAESGSHTWTGTAASLKAARKLSAASGVYTWTGTAAGLISSASTYTLSAEAGTFSWTGTAATPRAARKVAAAAGSYSWTGTAAAPKAARKIAATAGSFAWTGTAATLTLAVPAVLAPLTNETLTASTLSTYLEIEDNTDASTLSTKLGAAAPTSTPSIRLSLEDLDG